MSARDPFGEGAAAAKARRKRSLAIALGLIVFIVLIFGVTLVQIGRNAQRGEGLPIVVDTR